MFDDAERFCSREPRSVPEALELPLVGMCTAPLNMPCEGVVVLAKLTSAKTHGNDVCSDGVVSLIR